MLKLNAHGVSQPQWWASGAGALCWKGILGCALAGCSHPLLGSVPVVTPCAQPCACVYGSLCINHLFSFQDKGAFWLLQKLRQAFEEVCGGVLSSMWESCASRLKVRCHVKTCSYVSFLWRSKPLSPLSLEESPQRSGLTLGLGGYSAWTL